MSAISSNFGAGGAGLAPHKSSGSPDLATALREVAEDFEELRTQFVALLAKLDGQAVATSGDDDFESELTPAELKTTKA